MTQAPRLTRSAPAARPGIVHLGPGAFFRAFNAVYTEEAMQAEGGDWGIIAVSLRSASARDQMVPQGGVFTSVTLGEGGMEARVIGSVVDVLVAPEDPRAVVAAMADPGVKIVSLTVTEKGYCHAPATGALNPEHPDIIHDLAHPDAPRSAIGFIVAALAARRAAGAAPFTVLSCDNLPSNGALVRATVVDFAQRLGGDLAEWIKANVPFPATMVDRITPATTEADIARVAQVTGHYDPACVLHEGFRQWVIEDDFAQGRPAWEVAGAQFVTSVDAHELMKLRCLNGTHSTLAYLGYLAGYESIADTVADADFAELCEHLWAQEIIPTLAQPVGEDLPAYCRSLMARYRDRSIRHRTWQIAMDGSQKLPQRLLGAIADNLAMGRAPRGLALAVAGWMRYVGGVDEAGREIDVRDPLAEELRAASDGAEGSAAKVDVLLSQRAVFDAELAANETLRALLVAGYDTLATRGAKAALRELAGHGASG